MRLKKKENILVFGGSGFIGKKLVNALEGKITIVSRKKNLNINTIILDLEKDPIPINIFENIDRVYFLAGIAHDTKKCVKYNILLFSKCKSRK